jgi:hypothetical protein
MTDLQIFALLTPPSLVVLVGAVVVVEEYFNRREMRLEANLKGPLEYAKANEDSGDRASAAKSAARKAPIQRDGQRLPEALPPVAYPILNLP